MLHYYSTTACCSVMMTHDHSYGWGQTCVVLVAGLPQLKKNGFGPISGRVQTYPGLLLPSPLKHRTRGKASRSI
ncbi:hypothetical protein DCAR_0312132 [Daucus carota subsp. sativus]|uniref:Uncharacterized protein n=1 Tax=Daucus carota subsp. sativus TaxID=79200 RepID=A0A175YAN6_DAUCS|nr:hypothetical protein DCAR_0312132 [Daucus carota subsp. sativus]